LNSTAGQKFKPTKIQDQGDKWAVVYEDKETDAANPKKFMAKIDKETDLRSSVSKARPESVEMAPFTEPDDNQWV